MYPNNYLGPICLLYLLGKWDIGQLWEKRRQHGDLCCKIIAWTELCAQLLQASYAIFLQIQSSSSRSCQHGSPSWQLAQWCLPSLPSVSRSYLWESHYSSHPTMWVVLSAAGCHRLYAHRSHTHIHICTHTVLVWNCAKSEALAISVVLLEVVVAWLGCCATCWWHVVP